MYMYFDLENPFLTPISLWAKATYAMIWCPTSYIYISLNDGCQILKAKQYCNTFNSFWFDYVDVHAWFSA